MTYGRVDTSLDAQGTSFSSGSLGYRDNGYVICILGEDNDDNAFLRVRCCRGFLAVLKSDFSHELRDGTTGYPTFNTLPDFLEGCARVSFE